MLFRQFPVVKGASKCYSVVFYAKNPASAEFFSIVLFDFIIESAVFLRFQKRQYKCISVLNHMPRMLQKMNFRLRRMQF